MKGFYLLPRRQRTVVLLAWTALGSLLSNPASAWSQEASEVRVQLPDGFLEPELAMVSHHGFPAIPAADLTRLGWTVTEREDGVLARWKGGVPALEMRAGSPFLSWGGEGVHLAEAPYRESGTFFLPLQVVIDIFPWKLPEVFQFDPSGRTLVVRDPEIPTRFILDPKRVVIIDPGHGGRDSGARGRGGVQEKDVALAIGLHLARNLMADPNLEVYLTRDVDSLIPIWKRGELATDWKSDHPGVFVSIHANASPHSRNTRGFETFFLSEARTEHERRVAALENAAQEFEEVEEDPNQNSDMSFILTELRNLDHQHWSALLAEMVQEQLAEVHPGPNRGVKQGPLAVITNALMPAVLVEVGFVSNREEEILISERTFQENAATALASAIREFFRRYPGGEYGSGRGGP
jgi:N-acetylmuramoyl-L-alanine amidase